MDERKQAAADAARGAAGVLELVLQPIVLPEVRPEGERDL